jgi:hypothetical protein
LLRRSRVPLHRTGQSLGCRAPGCGLLSHRSGGAPPSVSLTLIPQFGGGGGIKRSRDDRAGEMCDAALLCSAMVPVLVEQWYRDTAMEQNSSHASYLIEMPETLRAFSSDLWSHNALRPLHSCASPSAFVSQVKPLPSLGPCGTHTKTEIHE